MRLAAAISLIACAAVAAITYTDNVQTFGAAGGVNYYEVNEAAPAAFNAYSTGFDGINDYCTAPDSASLDITVEISLTAWVKLSAVPFGQDRVINKTDRYVIYFSGNANPRGYIAGGANDLDSGFTLSTGQWYHVAITYDQNGGADNYRTYVDGDLKNTKTSASAIGTDNNPLTLGGYFDGSLNFPGKIDEAAVWDAALTSNQIAEVYNSGTALDLDTLSYSTNLVAWYRMGDDDTFSTILDQTANNNDMTMVNMSATNFVTDVP